MGYDVVADARTCLCTTGLAVVGVAPVDPAPGWAVGVGHIVSVFRKKLGLDDAHGVVLRF